MSCHRMLAGHLALGILLIHSAAAATSAWLDFDGDIPGGASEPAHTAWIDVSNFQISGMLDNVGGFSFVKAIDVASPLLFQACAAGTIYPRAVLDMRITDPLSQPRDLVRLELEDVMVSSLATSGNSQGGDTSETVGLMFGKITYTYYPVDKSETVFEYENVIGDPSDTDNDRIPDAWERDNGLIVGVDDSGLDPDNDGLSNTDEHMLGTDPQSGASFFKAVLAPKPETPGVFVLSWNSVIGKDYIVEWSPDLSTPFTTLQTVTAADASTVIDVTKASNLGFYRVRPAP